MSIRWRSNPSSAAGSREVPLDLGKLPAEVAPDPLMKAFEKGYLSLEVQFHTDKPPEELFRHVAVTFAPEQ